MDKEKVRVMVSEEYDNLCLYVYGPGIKICSSRVLRIDKHKVHNFQKILERFKMADEIIATKFYYHPGGDPEFEVDRGEIMEILDQRRWLGNGKS